MPREKVGSTPLGGTRSVAYLFDSTGAETDDFDVARTAEIVEYDGDEELGRTYVDLDAAGSVPSPPERDDPNSPENSDQKLSWDLYDNVDGQYSLVTTKDQLLHTLSWDRLPLTQQRYKVGNLLGLPVWEHAPASLKSEVYAWLESTRQE